MNTDRLESVESFDLNPWWPRAVVILILLIIAALAFTPEIAGFIYAFYH
jgi:hypothetical protein